VSARGSRGRLLWPIGVGALVLFVLLNILLDVGETSRSQARRLPPSGRATVDRETDKVRGSPGRAAPERVDTGVRPISEARVPEGFERRPVRPLVSAVAAQSRGDFRRGPWDRVQARMPEGRYEGRERDGPWTWFWDDGTPREFRFYRRGKLDGETWARFRSGRPEFEGHCRDNRRSGEWNWWFDTGNRRAIEHYANGRLHGEVVHFHENGLKRVKAAFVDGSLQGVMTLWHPDGTKAEERSYEAGAPTGTWRRWSERGELIAEIAVRLP
jgi:antitoxin component YwqK of YwqJK toxin-antitoxin module